MREELTTEKIIENCKKFRGEEYNYSKVKKWENGEETKIEVICQHGSYWTNYFDFIRGKANCPKCSKERRRKYEEEKFKSKMISKYGDNIAFPKDFYYVNSFTKVRIIYKNEEFFRDPKTFLKMPLLSKEERKEMINQRGLKKSQKRWENILDEFNLIHKNKYEYNQEEIELIKNGEFKRSDIMHIKCPKHGIFTQTFFDHRSGSGCRKCGIEGRPVINTSKAEKEIVEFIKSIYFGEIITNDRKILNGKEIDIYIPDLNLAFEYDGTFWHNNINNSYKFEECKAKGIRLIRITESEWITINNKIKNFIKSSFGVFDKKFFARKCEIKEINNIAYRNFCEENHLQGYAIATIRLGLFYKDELIQIMGFSKLGQEYEYEIIRECSKQEYYIIGGKGKLLKYFEINYKPKFLISYCEKNKFSGDSYLKLGFRLDKENQSDYNYYKGKQKLSRQDCQKSLFETFDENLSEWENMSNNGYMRLFDYGNYVFIKEYKYD